MRLRLLVACVALTIVAGCGPPDERTASRTGSTCTRGAAEPIGVSTLASTLRRHGFDLARNEDCMSAEDVASLTSDYAHASQEEVEREDGHVICTVAKKIGEPFRARTRLSRTKYREDEETYISVHNVLCAIYPAPEPTRAAGQVDRLERALRELARGCRVVSSERRTATCAQSK